MDTLVIGVVGRPHGVKGFVRVHSYSGETEHFLPLHNITLRYRRKDRHVVIEQVKVQSGHILMKFSGIETPEDAKALTDWEIIVPRSMAAPLGKNEYYRTDLEKCIVISEDKPVGRVTGVFDGPLSELIEVTLTEGQRYIVPFQDQYIGRVDILNKQVELKASWQARYI